MAPRARTEPPRPRRAHARNAPTPDPIAPTLGTHPRPTSSFVLLPTLMDLQCFCFSSLLPPSIDVGAIDDHLEAPGALSSPLSLPIKSQTPFLSSSPSSSLPSPYSSSPLSHTLLARPCRRRSLSTPSSSVSLSVEPRRSSVRTARRSHPFPCPPRSSNPSTSIHAHEQKLQGRRRQFCDLAPCLRIQLISGYVYTCMILDFDVYVYLKSNPATML
jgi:hypothetical protein